MFDCVYHSSLKARALRDPEFKTFLIGASLLFFSYSLLPRVVAPLWGSYIRQQSLLHPGPVASAALSSHVRPR